MAANSNGRFRLSVNADGISRLCLGTAQLGLDYGVANVSGRPDTMACDKLLERAIERGVLYWDTARAYGDAEERIGRFLRQHPRRDDVRLISKLPAPEQSVPVAGLTDWVTGQVDASRKDLQCDQLDTWMLHDAEMISRYGDAIWDAMLTQVERGATRSIGVSVYDVSDLSSSEPARNQLTIQLPFNLFDRRFRDSGFVNAAPHRSQRVFARSALLQGALTMSPDQLPDSIASLREPLQRLHRLLSDFGCSVLDVALPYVMSHSFVDFAVIGVDNLNQLEDNLEYATRRLEPELMETLDHSFQNLPAEIIDPRKW